MAAWTIADVREVAPEFTVALASDLVVTAWIARAARRINDSIWGARVVDAGAYMTAHLMAVAGVGPYVANITGSGQQVVSQAVGQVSVTYASPAARGVLATQPALGLSRHGVAYAELVALGGFGLQGIGL